jgi:transcriptional regulator with XRE-family HTH domain
MIVRMATDPRIGARIKIARARRGMSQQQVADAIGVARTTVDSWENGRSQPKRGKVLGALERELGVSLFEPETLGDLAADVASASGLTEAQKAALLTLIQSQNHSKP